MNGKERRRDLNISNFNAGDHKLTTDIMPFHLRLRLQPEENDFKDFMNMYLLPLIALLVVLLNLALIAVFVHGKFRSASHVVLIAISISNVTQTLAISLSSVYFYGFGFADEYVPYPLCVLNQLLTIRIPKVCSSVALFLTALLGIQRYIIVYFPIRAKSVLKLKYTVITIILLICFAIVSDLQYILNLRTIERVLVNSSVTTGKVVSACIWLDRPETDVNHVVVEVFTVFLPIITMVMFDAIIMYSLLRNKFTKQNSKRKNDMRRMVLITALIISSVIAISVPDVAIRMLLLRQNRLCRFCFLNKIKYSETMKCIHILTYAANFAIYSFLGQDFRNIIKRFLRCTTDHARAPSTIEQVNERL